MWQLLKTKVNLGFIANPFYIFCIAFSFAIFMYLWGWSGIFPKLSVTLVFFFLVSFIVFTSIGYKKIKAINIVESRQIKHVSLNDYMFWLIIVSGILNILFMGYIPIIDRSHDYRDFGIPVLDPVFNTLSIFFSVFFFQSFLENRKKRYLTYIFVILIIQVLLIRRSTIVWIITSSAFLFLFKNQNVRLLFIIIAFLLIPVFSYTFGLYGKVRSNLTESYIINSLGASDTFKKSGISSNHYMTYLYVSSPLANLQKNIDEGEGFTNRNDIKSFLFYCMIPESLTTRLENLLHLTPPVCNLITPHLIVGSFFMVSFYTMGWIGMIIMLLFLFAVIILCLSLIKKWDTFSIPTFSILTTAVSLLIFSNFLNRLDVIMMLFIYPILFHFVYTRSDNVLDSN
jgi:hypothetical protein